MYNECWLTKWKVVGFDIGFKENKSKHSLYVRYYVDGVKAKEHNMYRLWYSGLESVRNEVGVLLSS